MAAEDHPLHCDRGSELVGNAVQPSVGDRLVVVPGPEHGADRLSEPGRGSSGNISPVCSVNSARKRSVRSLSALLGQFDVVGGAPAPCGLPSANFSNASAETPRTTSPNICTSRLWSPRRSGVAACPGQPRDRGAVQPEVEDGVEHAGHRHRGPATESSRGSSSAPNRPIGVFLEASDSGVDLIVQTGWKAAGPHELDVQAVVMIVKPPGTLLRPRTLVISARLPLLPSSLRTSRTLVGVEHPGPGGDSHGGLGAHHRLSSRRPGGRRRSARKDQHRAWRRLHQPRRHAPQECALDGAVALRAEDQQIEGLLLPWRACPRRGRAGGYARRSLHPSLLHRLVEDALGLILLFALVLLVGLSGERPPRA